MRKDYLMDVLNDLDEDLISEANQCRKTRKHHDKRWLIPVAAAATFCIVVSVLFYGGGFGLLAHNIEDAAAIDNGDQQLSMQENMEEKTEISEESVQECPSVIVALENWTETGFIAIVTELVDTDEIPLGSSIMVKIDDHTILPVYQDDTAVDTKINDFSTIQETKFQIVFRPCNSDGLDEDTESACYLYTVYAEQIIPIEDGTE